MKLRSTKIVATMGPATSEPESLEKILVAGENNSGVNVVRMNFSHGDFNFHGQNIKTVREISKKLGKHTGIIADLPGPKIRIRSFANNYINLTQGQEFTIDVLKEDLGDETCVGVDYKGIIDDCKVGGILLLDDGNVELEITEVKHPKIVTKVISGHVLSNKKGINLKGGGLNAKAITARDEEIIKFATEQKVDFIAVSFVRKGSDMDYVRSLAKKVNTGHVPRLISKIERADIFPKDGDLRQGSLDEIILASDGVMVARGDLAVEVGVGAMLGLQKFITDRSISLNKFVITATQMMESMINNPSPTRAEVSDVGNAVLDCTDAVMLSAESAVGKYPAKTVENMDIIARGIEDKRYLQLRHSYHDIKAHHSTINKTIAAEAINATNNLKKVGAIISLTQSGNTALWLSRYITSKPIFGITNRPESARFMNILTNVHAQLIEDEDLVSNFEQEHFKKVVESLIKQEILQKDDKVILTRASSIKPPFQTNSLSIYEVSDIIGE